MNIGAEDEYGEPDFLDEMIVRRAERDPDFSRLVEEAYQRRVRSRGREEREDDPPPRR
jgi:hypothetical protein